MHEIEIVNPKHVKVMGGGYWQRLYAFDGYDPEDWGSVSIWIATRESAGSRSRDTPW